MGPKCAKVQKGANGAQKNHTAVVVIKVGINIVVFTLPRGSKAREITEKYKKFNFLAFLPRRPPKYLVHLCKNALGAFCDAKV